METVVALFLGILVGTVIGIAASSVTRGNQREQIQKRNKTKTKKEK